MNDKDRREDCRIHAFVDNQLDADDRAQLHDEMSQDKGLQQQICDTRRLKDLIKQAFAGVEPPSIDQQRITQQTTTQPHWFNLRSALSGAAATLILAVGAFTGWHTYSQSNTDDMSRIAAEEAARLRSGVTLDAVATNTKKVILHIDQSDVALFTETLNDVERILTEYKAENTEVEVIFNSTGINLLRTDTSPDAERIRTMINDYDRLRFVACRNTLQRLQSAGIKAHLIEDTHIAPSAVGHIIDRLQDGWLYIKV